MELIIRNLNSVLRLHGIKFEDLSPWQINIMEEVEDCWIAGGAALAIYENKVDKIKDWDLFFLNDESRTTARYFLLENKYKEVADTENSFTFSRDQSLIQLVKKNYSSVEMIFESFDFSVCCFATDVDTMFFTPKAKEDVENMVININRKFIHPRIISRVARYAEKGFHPTLGCERDIIRGIRKMSDDKFMVLDTTPSTS